MYLSTVLEDENFNTYIFYSFASAHTLLTRSWNQTTAKKKTAIM